MRYFDEDLPGIKIGPRAVMIMTSTLDNFSFTCELSMESFHIIRWPGSEAWHHDTFGTH